MMKIRQSAGEKLDDGCKNKEGASFARPHNNLVDEVPNSLLLKRLLFVSLFPVSCNVGEAESSSSSVQKLLFYVFGSEAIYVIDPESKTVLSKIEAEGVCTKSNNRYSR